jgi:hypothetical protein
MNKEKFILQEEINRMKKLATYDKSKTLNEQTAGEMEASGARYNDNVANNVKNIGLVKAKSPKFPCVYYKKNNLDTEGRYTQANMDFVRLFYPTSIVIVWENNTIKEYVRNGNASGAEIRKGTWKCNADNSSTDFIWDNNTPEQPKVQPAKKLTLKVAGQSTPNTKESSIGVNYQYEYPNDKKYSYGVKDKKWFGKNLANGREFDLSTIKTTIANLNRQFPNAMVEEPPLPAEKPAAPNPETATPGVVQEPTK